MARSGMPARVGISWGDTGLMRLSNGVIRPSASSGLVGAAAESYPRITTDAAGRLRGDDKSIGCLEPGDLGDAAGPLRPIDVGPEAYQD